MHRSRCSSWNRGRRRRSSSTTSATTLNELDVVAGEQTLLATAVLAHPPVVVHHVDVEHALALAELELVVLGFLVVVLCNCFVATGVVGTTVRIRSRAERSGCCSLAGTASWVLLFDLRLRLHRLGLRDGL